MSDDTLSMVVMIVIATITALCAHAFIRHWIVATLVSPTITTFLYQVFSSIKWGPPGAFVLIAIIAGWFYGLLFACAVGVPFWMVRRRRNHCRRCGYSLIGLTGPRCPQCETEFTPR